MQRAEQELLFLSVQDGDTAAFNRLVQFFHQPLVHYAYRICGDASLAEEAVQEAWLSFAKTHRQIKDSRAFRSHLYRLVGWRVTDAARANQKHREAEAPFVEEQHGVFSDQSDDSDLLRQAIDALPAVERQIIHLFYIGELSVAEVANVLAIAQGTVKSRLSRARKLLKTKLEAQQRCAG